MTTHATALEAAIASERSSSDCTTLIPVAVSPNIKEVIKSDVTHIVAKSGSAAFADVKDAIRVAVVLQPRMDVIRDGMAQRDTPFKLFESELHQSSSG